VTLSSRPWIKAECGRIGLLAGYINTPGLRAALPPAQQKGAPVPPKPSYSSLNPTSHPHHQQTLIMKVLIIGASGFIGLPVAQAFVRNGTVLESCNSENAD